MAKKKLKLLNKFTDLVSWFLGSWWAVIFHTVWFGIWLIFDFDINLLTFSVSLEAIFIGIFLLMSANKAEIQRDAREARQRNSDRKKIEHDIKLDEKADRQLTEMKKIQEEIHDEVKGLKSEIKKSKK